MNTQLPQVEQIRWKEDGREDVSSFYAFVCFNISKPKGFVKLSMSAISTINKQFLLENVLTF